MDAESTPVVAVSVGDLNGIGPEVILKTFSDSRIFQTCTPLIFASSKVLNFYKKSLELSEINYVVVKSQQEIQSRKINVFQCWDEDVSIEPGSPSGNSAGYAFKSLEKATQYVISNSQTSVLVTAPIDKHTMNVSGFGFPGHTEYLASLSSVTEYLMLMTSEDLKVALVTGHIPLAEVKNIDSDLILRKIRLLNDVLKKDFAIAKPKIALLGLNPHAGDNGTIGNEEQNIISPAIKKAFEEKIIAFGPYPADGFFAAKTFLKFDAVLAIYHDQGLIPFKIFCFENGVNFTAGLPFVRTSPDHGTAYDIAGKNLANESSFRNAVYTALDLLKSRQLHRQLKNNPLEVSRITAEQ